MATISSQQALSVASMIELTDKDLETLKYIKLEFDSTTLKAYATDRYVLARAVYELDEPTEPTTIYLDRGAVKFIKDNAKTATTFTLTQDTITANNLNTYALISDGSTLPKVDLEQVISKALDRPDGTEAISMNLKLIERVNKLLTPSQANLSPAKRRTDWIVRVGNRHDPIVFTESTDTFTALAQPLRRGN